MVKNHSVITKEGISSCIAYMAYTSRGNKFNVEVPNTAEALDAYEDGKDYILPRKVS